jgi:hypothetical protein
MGIKELIARVEGEIIYRISSRFWGFREDWSFRKGGSFPFPRASLGDANE